MLPNFLWTFCRSPEGPECSQGGDIAHFEKDRYRWTSMRYPSFHLVYVHDIDQISIIIIIIITIIIIMHSRKQDLFTCTVWFFAWPKILVNP